MYTAWSVVYGEQPSTAKWNLLGQNDASFNDGTGIADNAILGRHLSASLLSDWKDSVLPAVSSVTYNGNHSYTITFASTVASTLSPQMRLRIDRTTDAPSQCTSLNGTNQYWDKSSPSGITFTGAFSAMAHIKLTAYGTNSAIIGRDSAGGTLSGWEFLINTTGQVQIYCRNGSGALSIFSHQSIPLNKWVHVAGSLNPSGSTGEIYIDGVSVPVSIGTGATTVVQASTNLTIGKRNTAANYFPGKISQVALFSTNLSGSTIRSYISQGLTGSETNCIGYWSFDGNGNDSNASANNLTAQASATATNSDSPFCESSSGTPGTYDYAMVQSISGSSANVLVPEGCAIPTSGSITSVDYATSYSPLGFPVNQERWEIIMSSRIGGTQTNPVSGTWYNLTGTSGVTGGHKITAPIGVFKEVSYRVVASASTVTTSNAVSPYATLSTGSSTESDTDMTTRAYAAPAGATSNQILSLLTASKGMTFASATDLYLNMKVDIANDTALQSYGSNSATLIKLVPAGI